MGTAIAPLQVFQGGPEVTPGTAVAATRKFSVENFGFTPTDALFRPRLTNGILLDNPGGEMVMTRGTEWTANGPVIYNELQRWASMVIGTPVITGTNPYTYTFTKAATTNPTLKTWTLERRLSDGTNHIDNEFTYSIGTSLTISGAIDEPLRFEVNGIARRILSSTLTPALTLVTTEIPPALLGAVWIDSTFAALGTTQITGQVLSYSVTFRSGVTRVNTMDARTDLDYATHAINGREVGVDMQIRMMVKADSGQYATEKTAAEAATLRAVRFKVLGAASAEVTVDALVKHVAGSVFAVDEQDGYLVVDLNLVSSTDNTNAFVLKVVNAEATL